MIFIIEYSDVPLVCYFWFEIALLYRLSLIYGKWTHYQIYIYIYNVKPYSNSQVRIGIIIVYSRKSVHKKIHLILEIVILSIRVWCFIKGRSACQLFYQISIYQPIKEMVHYKFNIWNNRIANMNNIKELLIQCDILWWQRISKICFFSTEIKNINRLLK